MLMHNQMTDLPALLSRLEAAEGPSRELDSEIVRVLCPSAVVTTYLASDDEDSVFHAQSLGLSDRASVPAYTASLDAALALAERALPGWGWSITRKDKWSWVCVNEPDATVEIVRGEHTQPALALCIAIVKAKIQQAKDAP